MRFRLQEVHYIPDKLDPGILYVSKEFGIAMHLCPCGCGSSISTPIGPTEWSICQTKTGPTLNPSVGNWQEACRSHYWIRGGEVVWAESWTPEQILAGRLQEEERTRAYFASRASKGPMARAWRWLKLFVGKLFRAKKSHK